MAQHPLFEVRDATSADLDLTYLIARDAMHEYVVKAWGRWDESEQRQRHEYDFDADMHKLVLVEHTVVGFVAKKRFSDHVWLAKLYLLSAFRGRGIGSALLAQVLREADELGKPVRLRMLRVNTRAQALYTRHGFNVVKQTPERIFMEKPVRAADV